MTVTIGGGARAAAGGVGGLQGTPSSLSGALSVTAVGGGAGAGPGGAGSGGSGGGGNPKLVVLDKVLMSQDKEILVVMVFHQVVQHMDLEVVVVLEALDKTEHHLRVVMEVWYSTSINNSKIQDHQLEVDQDQQLSSLLVVEEEFLMMQNQPPDKVVDHRWTLCWSRTWFI